MKSSNDRRRACCAHSPYCAVHQVPFDNGYVACTCEVGEASLRHERVEDRRPQRLPPASVRDLSDTARGALIAIEAGEREIAARLLADVIARAERAAHTAPQSADD